MTGIIIHSQTRREVSTASKVFFADGYMESCVNKLFSTLIVSDPGK